MKIEELIKRMKDPNDRSGNDVDMEAVLETIIQALEKQVPKKPIETEHLCPSCNEYFMNDRGYPDEYCCLCGQKIDWGNEE